MITLKDMVGTPSFDGYVQTINKAGSDSSEFFGGEFSGGYCLQQNPQEFAALLCFLEYHCAPIKRYAEIGSASGGTIRLLNELIGIGEAVVMDEGTHLSHQIWETNTKGLKSCRFFKGDSHSKVCEQWLKDLGIPKFEVIWIDGDHSYEGVLKDAILMIPYCDKHTFVLFHDTVACPGVKQVWDMTDNKVAEFISPDKPFGIGVCHV